MTQQEFDKRTRALIRELKPYLYKECMRLYRCGGVNLKNYMDNYVLPAMILRVALENNARQYSIRSECKKDYKNLQHF